MLNQKLEKIISSLIQSKFKNKKGEPYIATPSQCWMFASLINKNIKWLWESAPTRYGKSEITAMAYIYLASHQKIKIPIVGGSSDKADKIMQYVLQHLPDNPSFYEGLINLTLSDVEKLKVSMGKELIRWSDGGWIFITSIDSRSISKEGEGAVGEGGDIVHLEEAGLIKHKDQFSKIVRMPEEDNEWGKLVMSGNCIEGSVFEDAYKNPIYTKVKIDLETAIREGRYTRDRLFNEIKPQMTSKDWKRYYLVEFPDVNEFTYFKPKKYDLLPSFDNMDIYGAFDPSLGEEKKQQDKKQTGSKKGLIVIGVDKKTLDKYEIYSLVDHVSLDTIITEIFNMPYKFKRFAIEAVQFQKYFLDEIKIKSRELGKDIPFEGLQQRAKKEERIESLEPAIGTGRIKFKGNNQLWEDMASYPKTEYLDGLDALEMAHRISEKKKPTIGFGEDVI